MKIYTKTGDKGSTGLYAAGKVSKDSSYIEAYGDVDELNAFIGYCVSACTDEEIKKVLMKIQNDLHSVCADLSTPIGTDVKIDRIEPEKSKELETLIDKYDEELDPLKQFILAGGSELASRLHLSRTVARRSERRVVNHSHKEQMNQEVIVYLNRLSDLLFVLARAANKRAGVQDIPWKS